MNTENEKKSKDERLSKQLGDFGEALVMFILGHIKGYRVALVDHEGADIIATDREKNGNKYAISVKSRCFKTDNPQIPFEKDQQKKLKDFADEFGMISTVAFVMIDKEKEIVDVYIVTLDNMQSMSNEIRGISSTGIEGEKLHFSNAKLNQSIIQNQSGIDHTRLKIDIKSSVFNI